MPLIVDSHLDLAWNALSWKRDLTLPLDEMNARDAQLDSRLGRGRATITFPEMRRGGVFLCLGTLMARVGPDLMAEALARFGAQQMEMGGRTMKGYVEVEADAIEDDDVLTGWLALCEQFVGTLPPK